MNTLLLLCALAVPLLLLALCIGSRRSALLAHKRHIEELAEARAAVAVTSERVHRAVEATYDGIWEWDVPTNAVYYSESWKAMLGYADTELASHYSTWEALVHPDDKEPALEKLRLHFESSEPQYQTEFRMRHKNGEWVWLETRGRIIARDENGAPLRMSGVATDITQRKRNEAALRDSEARIRSVFEQAYDAIFVVSADNRFLDVNGRGLEMTGYSREEFLQLGVADILSEHERKRLEIEPVEMMAGKPHLAVWEHRRKDGSKFFAEVSARRLDDSAYIAVVRDLTERNEARAQIREQERRFQSTIENLQMLGVMLDRSGAITFCNDYLLSCTGWRREDILGRNWFELFVPNTSANSTMYMFERAIAGGRMPAHYENEILTRERNLLVVRWNNTVLRSSQGEVIGTISLGEDITEHRHALDALRRSEQRLREIIDGLGPYMFVGLLDADGITVEANSSALAASALRADDVLGRHFADTFWWSHSADVQLKIRDAVTAAARGQGSRFDIEARGKDDDIMTLDFSIQPLRSKSGKIEFLVPSAIVITERKRVERALRESESRWRLALEAAHLGTFEWDVARNHIVWSRWHEELWGFSEGEFKGTFEAFSERVHPDDLPSINAKILAAMRTRQPYQEEFRVIWPDGSLHWISGRGEFTFDAAGEPKHMHGAVIDVTPLKQAEATLQRWAQELENRVAERTVELEAIQAELRVKNEELIEQYKREQTENKYKSEFLANMSHELRTPLNAIIGFTELLHDGRVGPVTEQQVEYLGDVLASARHLLQLINDVLDLARIEAGRLEFRNERVELKETLREVAAVMHALLLAKAIVLELEVDPQLGPIDTDVGKIKQILYNYISNAIKFSDPGGRVILRALGEGEREFRIEVQDFGIGIRPEDQTRLFEQFEQLDLGSARKQGGSGLGLALTRRLVEAQGGRVGVKSELNHGSTFFAVLPRASVAPANIANDTAPSSHV